MKEVALGEIDDVQHSKPAGRDPDATSASDDPTTRPVQKLKGSPPFWIMRC
jgi:hypothetical protein